MFLTWNSVALGYFFCEELWSVGKWSLSRRAAVSLKRWLRHFDLHTDKRMHTHTCLWSYLCEDFKSTSIQVQEQHNPQHTFMSEKGQIDEMSACTHYKCAQLLKGSIKLT